METRLLDRDAPPDDAAFAGAMGAAGGLWIALDHWLAGIGAVRSPSWGGRANGWELRYRRAGRPLTTVSPADEAFIACVVLGAEAVAESATLALGPETRRSLDSARRYPDGTWLFLRVRSSAELVDLERLIELKLPTSVRRRLAGA